MNVIKFKESCNKFMEYGVCSLVRYLMLEGSIDGPSAWQFDDVFSNNVGRGLSQTVTWRDVTQFHAAATTWAALLVGSAGVWCQPGARDTEMSVCKKNRIIPYKYPPFSPAETTSQYCFHLWSLNMDVYFKGIIIILLAFVHKSA